MTTEEDSIEQAAASRRERLNALKAARELLNSSNEDSVQHETKAEDDEETTEQDKELSMKFRNYLPQDNQLKENKIAPPVLPKFEDPVATAPPSENIEDPFLNIAPKKPNWDLRRDVQKKLEKLERRTQKAMYELMEEQEKLNQASAEENSDGLTSD